MPTLRHVFVVNIHYVCHKGVMSVYHCICRKVCMNVSYEKICWFCVWKPIILCIFLFLFPKKGFICWWCGWSNYTYETDPHYAYRTGNWICWLSVIRHERQMIALTLCVVASSYKRKWRKAVAVCSSVYYGFPMPENSVYVAAPCSTCCCSLRFSAWAYCYLVIFYPEVFKNY